MSQGGGAQKQRTGYTTGSCAAAGARAALRAAITGDCTAGSMAITIPRGDTIPVPIKECTRTGDDRARCVITKDGGDDPDVTHGADIVVDLYVTGRPDEIEIDGGEGVGVVTKPGLGLEIGKPAINPVPKRMIVQNLREEAAGSFWDSRGIRVVISVPRGRELGPRTDNPRLGIIGGISILGTSGIVIPFSTASYAASIRQNLDVAAAMGEDTIVLTTGGRSEEFARNAVARGSDDDDTGAKQKASRLPDHCFVQMGDFAGYSVRESAKRSAHFRKVYVVGFVGKLAKMATGVKQTHVKGSKVDMKFLSGLAAGAGAPDDVVRAITKANTARHVSEIMSGLECAPGFFEMLCAEVHKHMKNHAQSDIAIEVVLFGFDGSILARAGA
ncbi:MAG: cobalt-precorrin-5B (C(1))-methyltransferase [Nitrosopumilaceae archaeon]|nr:cobalt-precorrin-5B (C(1))-methyltransferase [Nitrosopumilaceae archaeon]